MCPLLLIGDLALYSSQSTACSDRRNEFLAEKHISSRMGVSQVVMIGDTTMKVLVYNLNSEGSLQLTAELQTRITNRVRAVGGTVIFAEDHATAVQQVRDADIVFGYVTPEMLAVARQLQWIQAPISSFGYYDFRWGPYYIFPALVSYPVTLTSASGIYNDIIATHVFALITAIARNLPTFIRQQQDHQWTRGGQMLALSQKTIGIIGFGGVGKEVARLANAFRMTVVAVDPDPRDLPSYVSSLWSPEELHQALSLVDFVVLCLPDAPGTLHLIGESELRAMKPTAYLINIGRGNTVDLKSLTHALTEKLIAGAGLDVFGPGFEPLPPSHPLWACDNVLITPHRAGAGTPTERRVTVFLENFRRFSIGAPLLNVVDKQRMVVTGPRFQLTF